MQQQAYISKIFSNIEKWLLRYPFISNTEQRQDVTVNQQHTYQGG